MSHIVKFCASTFNFDDYDDDDDDDMLSKTGSESSVDRLMKQITSFMSEIPDEFKVVVVQAIRSFVSAAFFASSHVVIYALQCHVTKLFLNHVFFC